MKNLKLYKSKYKYINLFLMDNHILLVKADTNEADKESFLFKYNNTDYRCILLDNKASSKRMFELLKTIVFHQIDYVYKPDCLYINKRYQLEDAIYLSKKLGIKMKKIDAKTKVNLITYHYFKIKDLISRLGYPSFFEQYYSAGVNDYLEKIQKYIKDSLEDYFYITTLKNIIRIYSKEIDNKVDCNCPSFKNAMIFKYLDNYFSKFVVIDYDKDKIQEFISKYYVTSIQSEDHILFFLYDFLSLYQMIIGTTFSYENKYQLDLKRLSLFSSRKALKSKPNKFYAYFDKVMGDDNNYYNFMFLLEVLELNKHNSSKKEILSFLSIFELLLVKGDKNISFQLQNKCLKLSKKGDYSLDEFRLIYEYRSKVIHGDYKRSIDKLHELSKLAPYKFTEKEISSEIYLNFEQMLENRVKDRLFAVLKLTLKRFIYKNDDIRQIKNLKF